MIRPTPSRLGRPPDGCPVTECLTVLSSTWTAELFWFLREPRRFGDLKRDLRGISAKVLTERLRDLERRGLVDRALKPTRPQTVEYALTPLGCRFVPVIEQIAGLGMALQRAPAASG